jgi:membrane-bound lytic murein transglycosylase B
MAAKSSSAPRAAAALVALLPLVLLAACAGAPTPQPARPAAAARPAAPHPPAVSSEPAAPSAAVLSARAKGWGWMVEKLAADGISRESAARAFADPRVPAFDGLYFGLDPRESHALYRHYLRAPSVARAKQCAGRHADALDAAERIHGVDSGVLAAILHVETACGANTGRSLVLHRLARLAMANEPRNVARNLARWTGPEGALAPELGERVRARARYLEGIFYPQVVATFEIAAQNRIDPLSLRGSSAGAFGFPQFLPLNYIAFGTDGNGDGRVSLYDADDAIASAARFLASYGWRPGLSREQQRELVWHYNRSDAYIDAVLGLARHIDASGVVQASMERARQAETVATLGGVEAELVPIAAPESDPELPATRHP